MKAGLETLPGKTIVAVVVDEKRGRVFLVFSDDTHFEFYPGAGAVNWTRAADRGGLQRVLESLQEEKPVVIFQ
jgi:hypothetical protein